LPRLELLPSNAQAPDPGHIEVFEFCSNVGMNFSRCRGSTFGETFAMIHPAAWSRGTLARTKSATSAIASFNKIRQQGKSRFSPK
jgi:hypothetical protein